MARQLIGDMTDALEARRLRATSSPTAIHALVAKRVEAGKTEKVKPLEERRRRAASSNVVDLTELLQAQPGHAQGAGEGPGQGKAADAPEAVARKPAQVGESRRRRLRRRLCAQAPAAEEGEDGRQTRRLGPSSALRAFLDQVALRLRVDAAIDHGVALAREARRLRRAGQAAPWRRLQGAGLGPGCRGSGCRRIGVPGAAAPAGIGAGRRRAPVDASRAGRSVAGSHGVSTASDSGRGGAAALHGRHGKQADKTRHGKGLTMDGIAHDGRWKRHRAPRRWRLRAALGTTLLCLIGTARAQVAEDAPSTTPYRPSVSTPAALSAPGWIEIETGFLHEHDGDGARRDSLPTTVKLAFTPDWGIRIGSDAWVRQRDEGGGARERRRRHQRRAEAPLRDRRGAGLRPRSAGDLPDREARPG